MRIVLLRVRRFTLPASAGLHEILFRATCSPDYECVNCAMDFKEILNILSVSEHVEKVNLI